MRVQGITNIQINVDWRHLLTTGEHLPEDAALLDAEKDAIAAHELVSVALGAPAPG